MLPVPEPKRPFYPELDGRNVKAPPRFEVKAPAGTPNVVIVLIDDLGFGVPGAFGGPVRTPTLDRLAQNGLRYTSFHTTALCPPTRAALKSGRNHHTVNMGFITEMATFLPGATGQIPNATAPLAEMLRLNGVSTGAFGKWHETPAWSSAATAQYKMTTPIAPGVATPDRLETSIGTLTMTDGTPDSATAQKIYDNLDRSRALTKATGGEETS